MLQLKCGHVFGLKCLQRLRQGGDGLCPECREENAFPEKFALTEALSSSADNLLLRCSLCGPDEPRRYLTTLPCGDSYCIPCLKRIFEPTVELEKKAEQRAREGGRERKEKIFAKPCPRPRCGVDCSSFFAKARINRALQDRLKTFYGEHAIAQDSDGFLPPTTAESTAAKLGELRGLLEASHFRSAAAAASLAPVPFCSLHLLLRLASPGAEVGTRVDALSHGQRYAVRLAARGRRLPPRRPRPRRSSSSSAVLEGRRRRLLRPRRPSKTVGVDLMERRVAFAGTFKGYQEMDWTEYLRMAGEELGGPSRKRTARTSWWPMCCRCGRAAAAAAATGEAGAAAPPLLHILLHLLAAAASSIPIVREVNKLLSLVRFKPLMVRFYLASDDDEEAEEEG